MWHYLCIEFILCTTPYYLRNKKYVLAYVHTSPTWKISFFVHSTHGVLLYLSNTRRRVETYVRTNVRAINSPRCALYHTKTHQRGIDCNKVGVCCLLSAFVYRRRWIVLACVLHKCCSLPYSGWATLVSWTLVLALPYSGARSGLDSLAYSCHTVGEGKDVAQQWKQ